MLKNGPNYDYLVFLILDSDFSVLISTRSPTLESRELGLHSPGLCLASKAFSGPQGLITPKVLALDSGLDLVGELGSW